MNDKLIIEIFGNENLEKFDNQIALLDSKEKEMQELSDLRKRAIDSFKVNLTMTDIVVSASTGVLLGLGNALFKNFFHIESINSVPKNGEISSKVKWKNTFGSYKHNHEVTSTIIDSQPPRMPGMKLPNNLHRQIGPTHDIFRFKETLSLLTGNTSDYTIWGDTATRIIGHQLRPIGSSFTNFISSGGFRIPANPARELTNHLLIDFFSKTSLPIPGSTFIADHSPEHAKLMLSMYENGLNLKNTAGNLLGYFLVQIIIHGYTFLFKAIPNSTLSLTNLNLIDFKNLISVYSKLIRENEFHVQMIIAHGASFLVDSLITVGTKSYTGLFQLNYISLLAFSKHLLQYLLKSTKEYNEFIKQAKDKSSTIGLIDQTWYLNFKSNFNSISSNEHFVSLFNNDEIIETKKRTIDVKEKIKKNSEMKRKLIQELKSE